ncbi:glycosyltransferase [Microbacterium sp. 1P10UB]|uniref:glycosyltransferase n=1 Tax=unclassified Microbacterium TaxID=2609290 RepID=UPI0039A0F939
MAAEFDHLVLTKFNILTTPEYGPAGRRLEDAWLERRLAEFETFSLPSLKSQSTKAFRWLIFCDDESPRWFKERMASYGPLVEPVFVSGMTNATMGALLRDRRYTGARPLITTRVDNDDALAIDFIEAVQSEYAGQDRVFINFPWGLRACDGALFTGYWHSNPFMSLIERPPADGAFRCVYFRQHHLVKKTEKVVNVRRPPSWIRAMHASNTVQTQVGLPRLADRSPLFNIEWDRLPESPSMARKILISANGYRARLQRSSKFKKLTGHRMSAPSSGGSLS